MNNLNPSDRNNRLLLVISILVGICGIYSQISAPLFNYEINFIHKENIIGATSIIIPGIIATVALILIYGIAYGVAEAFTYSNHQQTQINDNRLAKTERNYTTLLYTIVYSLLSLFGFMIIVVSLFSGKAKYIHNISLFVWNYAFWVSVIDLYLFGFGLLAFYAFVLRRNPEGIYRRIIFSVLIWISIFLASLGSNIQYIQNRIQDTAFIKFNNENKSVSITLTGVWDSSLKLSVNNESVSPQKYLISSIEEDNIATDGETSTTTIDLYNTKNTKKEIAFIGKYLNKGVNILNIKIQVTKGIDTNSFTVKNEAFLSDNNLTFATPSYLFSY